MISAVSHRQRLSGSETPLNLPPQAGRLAPPLLYRRRERGMRPLNVDFFTTDLQKMKNFFLSVFSLTIMSSCAKAQDSSSVHKHRIAIFTPLYLDSAFDWNNEYRYANNALPKFINPGLEFYEGTQLALDSLNKEAVPLEVFVYDTRSAKESLTRQLNKAEADSVELIITFCSASEIKTFADAGLKRNIPVINANLPNDGGVTGNPFLVLLNSTLKTQCEGIYRHIQKYYP